MELSIVIPAYNEEGNIKFTIKESLEFLSYSGLDGEIVAVDDGSLDNTFSLLQELQEEDSRIRLFRHAVNKGLGSALLTGYSHARGNFVTFIPADGQIHPAQLNNLLEKIAECDLVISKYITRSDSLIRIIISNFWHFLIKLILGYRIGYNAIYMFRRELLADLPLIATTGLVNFEFIQKVKAGGYDIGTVFVSCQNRLSGRSKVCNFKTISKILWEMLKLRFSS